MRGLLECCPARLGLKCWKQMLSGGWKWPLLAKSVTIIERTVPHTSWSQGGALRDWIEPRSFLTLFELPPIGLSTCHARRRLAAADAVEHHYFQEVYNFPVLGGSCRRSHSPSSAILPHLGFHLMQRVTEKESDACKPSIFHRVHTSKWNLE